MFLVRFFCLILVCILGIIFFKSPVFSQKEFNISYNTTYQVYDSGQAQVTQEITLHNNMTQVYASNYALHLEGKRPDNIKVVEDNFDIPFEVQEELGKTKIIVNFKDALVGREKTRIFTIFYGLSNVAQKNGQVWDVTVPKLANPDSVDEYKLNFLVPKSFGELAYISPQPYSKSQTSSWYQFEFVKDDLFKAGVVAAFGQFQTINFDLTYNIKNPNNQPGETKIALIPDTAYQRVYYELIDPEPVNISLDDDGNWLATYYLKASEEKQVKVKVDVQIFSSPQKYYPEVDPLKHPYYLSATDKWQATDPEIQKIAALLKTPRAIYSFVVSKLEYNYTRVSKNPLRLGAKEALINPQEAICMEFTDLFIALARAAGIPAREINGYAYTENPELQPLSLVADVLHSWPEYWDSSQKVWRPVDPTWEDTTGGIDYFDKFDLSHVTFVIHGKNTNYPYPAGSYKNPQSLQKDVLAQFGVLPDLKVSQINTEVVTNGIDKPFSPLKRTIKVYNSGPVAYYNVPVNINTRNALATPSSSVLPFLAPFSWTTQELEYKLPTFLKFLKASSIISVGDSVIQYDIPEAQFYLTEIITILGILALIVLLFFAISHFLPKINK